VTGAFAPERLAESRLPLAVEERERRVRDRLATAATRHLRPEALADDTHARFRRDAFDALAREGVMTLAVPESAGGAGLSWRAYWGALEEIGRASPAMAITIGVSGLIQGALQRFGTEAQRQAWLPKLYRGEWIGAFSLSEPQAGSDAAALRLKVTRVDGGYRLDGNKVWCSTAGEADIYLVMGRTGEHRTRGITAFAVPATTPGFRVGKRESKLGLCASPLAELVFEDAFVPETHRIGAEGEGLTVALSQLDPGRVTIGVVGLAIAVEAIAITTACLRERERRTGTPTEEGTWALLGQRLAEAMAVRTLVAEAASARDLGQSLTAVASATKLLGSDLAMRTADDCLTLLGPEGAARSVGLERLFRDAKALQIVEGTNQIQRMVLGRAVQQHFS
jgi:alkylation response protein AidB-like acyl-CoA dehydrogenase